MQRENVEKLKELANQPIHQTISQKLLAMETKTPFLTNTPKMWCFIILSSNTFQVIYLSLPEAPDLHNQPGCQKESKLIQQAKTSSSFTIYLHLGCLGK